MSEEKVSEFIAVLMGTCWHEWKMKDKDAPFKIYVCMKCGDDSYVPEAFYYDAFTPDGIWEWKEWMETNMAEVWEEYTQAHTSLLEWDNNAINDHYLICNKDTPAGFINNILNPSNFAEWMAENVELWAWMECPCPPVFQGDVELMHICQYCNGTGKIINPKYAKAVEWLKEKEGR